MTAQTSLSSDRGRSTTGRPSSFADQFARYDRMMEGYERALIDAAELRSGMTVIDVGCGAGTTSLDAARAVGGAGHVLGVDGNRHVLQVARARADAAELPQLSFLCADAVRHRFPPGQADVVLSRFGTLHLSPLEAGYENLRRALSPAGRLCFVCGREAARNLWATVPLRVLASLAGRLPEAGGKRGPFVLADPTFVRALLTGAGFRDVQLTSLDHEVCLGADVDDALAFFFETDGKKLEPLLETIGYDRAVDALRDALSPYESPAGVFMPASAWLVRARV